MIGSVADKKTPTTNRILVCDTVDNLLLEGLKKNGHFVEYRPKITRDELQNDLGKFGAVVVRSRTKLDSSIINSAGELKIIARAGIGTDNIDMDAAALRGIEVITAAGSSTQSVVELNVALAIDMARKISHLDRNIRTGDFKKEEGTELRGKTAGIIGFGRIGYETAMVLRALGMNIIAYDVVENKDAINHVQGKYLSLNELLGEADFIFILVTLNRGSKSLIGEKELSLVRRGAFIVNTSRAEAIDGKALLKSLEDAKIGGYASDVLWNEPPKEEWEKKLISMNNVVITPHIGAQTAEAQKRVAQMTMEKLLKALDGAA